jgi:hypothetical protein
MLSDAGKIEDMLATNSNYAFTHFGLELFWVIFTSIILGSMWCSNRGHQLGAGKWQRRVADSGKG